MLLTNEFFKEYNNVICNVIFHDNYKALKDFISQYPNEYKYITKHLQKRTKIRTNLKAMLIVSSTIHWGTLTYDNEEDSNEEKNKRRKAIRYLNKYYKLWLMVEEHGEDYGRYHIHYFGVPIDEELPYQDIKEGWNNGYCYIEGMQKWKLMKKARYLTKYATKQVPMLRRNKRLIALEKDYKKLIKWESLDFYFYWDTFCTNNEDLIKLPF